ncbi:Rossmann-like and DUF2520 domain-containing protein [Parapedobacter tibetensis]|uniref:Rossmann-like and DUF2520 domain-containing protein n=1 Tax=Parapedobacter tibetensis TaxID=2972951 RepID=UPI00214D94E1|nr:Rossmann-like and DUF2520 domain-containing protein [Parapedobacter tibetensis]
MDVILLGSGNVATHLGKALTEVGHRIAQVYSPSKTNAELLAEALKAKAIDNLADVDSQADAYIIAVKDDAIAQVASQLPTHLKGLVVHTAGSVDATVLAAYTMHYGVLYPLQTFSKAKAVDFSSIPLAIEGADEATYVQLENLASSLSNRVFPCDSKQRLSLHVAAVFACNFTNYLYSISADILYEHNLDFDVIRPLILETAEKVMIHLPEDVLTGPAVRNDRGTIEKHLEMLEGHPDLKELYARMSKQLRQYKK